MRIAVCLCVTVMAAMRVWSDDRPAAFWWSAPVNPGELVQLHGGAWGEKPIVELAEIRSRPSKRPTGTSPRVPDFTRARRIVPVNVTDTGICFEFPKDVAAGLAACRVVADSGLASDPFVLNEPAVWWTQGDQGEAAAPGGWLRLFGRCLDVAGQAQVFLTAEDRAVELTLEKRDTWSLHAAVPNDLPAGGYNLLINNGTGGREGWRSAGQVVVRPGLEVWKADRFVVTDFGAIPNDGFDDTLALQAALAQAATNGGGVVYLPCGRFQCCGTLQIPPHTLLRGESLESTSLYWPDCEEPPENLIEGTTAFGVEDLFIHAGKYRNGIVCKNEAAGKHELGGGFRVTDATPRDITIRRVILKLLIDQYLIKNTAEYEKRAYLRGNGLVIRDARNVNVEECDIYCSKEGSTTLYFVLSAEYLHVRNCRINGSGWAVVGGDKVIFENNEAYNCTYSIAPVCRNLFWSRNRQHDLFTNNRESITHDGARTAHTGLLPARCEGTRLTLDFGAAKPGFRNGPDYWIGQNVQLVDGLGAGQTRTVVALTNNVVTLDRPWSVAPDATSRFVIAAERRHLLYVDNDTEDSSIAIQLYGGLTEGVLARNRSARSGGFLGFGMDYHGIIPLWYVQYLDNEIAAGSGYRGASNEMTPGDSVMAFLDHGNGSTLTRSCVIRRGLLRNNARIDMTSANGLVEDCVIQNADTGIRVGAKHASSVVLRGNRFEKVREPLDIVARQQAVMLPAERALVQLTAAEAALSEPPARWAAIKKALARDASEASSNEAAARDALLQALRALSTSSSGRALDLRVAEALLGVSLRIQPWDSGMTRLLASQDAAEAAVTLQAGLAPGAPETACAVTFPPVPGWQFAPHAPARLAPGAPAAIKINMRAPAGPKGFFSLPTLVNYSGDGWSLTCETRLATLTQNRLCQWIANSGNGVAWQPLTNTTVHGQMILSDVLGNSPTGATATAFAVLCAARNTPVRFEFEGPIILTVDGARIGTDIQRGTHGGAALAPGDHVLKAVFTRKKPGDALFKVACDTAGTCLPGDLTVVPASELLRTGLPSGTP